MPRPKRDPRRITLQFTHPEYLYLLRKQATGPALGGEFLRRELLKDMPHEEPEEPQCCQRCGCQIGNVQFSSCWCWCHTLQNQQEANL